MRDILTTLRANPPAVFVIDSIQTMFIDNLESAPGSVGQVRASAQALIQFAKESGSIAVLVGHVTKDGQIAGPRVLEHMVDTVLYFEGERSHQFRHRHHLGSRRHRQRRHQRFNRGRRPLPGD